MRDVGRLFSQALPRWFAAQLGIGTHQTNAGVVLCFFDLDVVLHSLSLCTLQCIIASEEAKQKQRGRRQMHSLKLAAYQAFALLPAHRGKQLKATGMLLYPLIPFILFSHHFHGSR